MPPNARRLFGTSGEDVAACFLEGKGMKILFRQKRTPVGEIDLVCLDEKIIVFVEVKTRRTLRFGSPQASITASKFRHMAAAAQVFLGERGWLARAWRLDVVGIYWPKGCVPTITHFLAVDNPAAF